MANLTPDKEPNAVLAEVRRLEEIASANPPKPYKPDGFNSSMADYLQGLQISRENLNAYITRALSRTNIEIPLLIADIGGFTGHAARAFHNINDKTGQHLFSAFVIDTHPVMPNDSSGLPRNRYITANAESMPAVPDNSFHLVVSYNCLYYTDVSKSLKEIYRILKPGGTAILDIEHWTADTELLANILRSGLGKCIKVPIEGAEPVEIACYQSFRTALRAGQHRSRALQIADKLLSPGIIIQKE